MWCANDSTGSCRLSVSWTSHDQLHAGMQGRLSGKTVVVLGASATGGSGWRIAQAFAGAGAHVFVAARSLDKVQVLAAEIG